MSRKVQFHENSINILFTGLTSLAGLKHELSIPYSAIKNVSVGGFDISPFNFRVGTSGSGKNLREGRFLAGRDWIFLSYVHHENVVILDLEGHEYKKVVFEIENPEEIKNGILQHQLKLAD